MKTTKKVISILLTLLMMVSIIPMSAFAENTTAEQFISNDNLCVIAERLLKDLADRIDDDLGTILRLVFQFMDDDSLTSIIAGRDIMTLDDEALAKILVDWLNANLPEWTEDIPSIKLGIVTVDLTSVDSVITSLESIASSSVVKNIAGGDAKKLTNDGLKKNKKVITTKNGFSNKEVICALFNWLAADGQISVIKEVIKGDLNLGSFIENLGVSLDDINDTMKNLPTTIKELIYDMFCEFNYIEDAEGTYKMVEGVAYEIEEGEEVTVKYRREKVDLENSSYKNFTADQLLAAALLHLIVDDATVSQADAQEATTLTLYQLLGKYAKKAIEKYAVEPINGQFKNWLQNDVATDANYSFLATAINWDYEVTAETFNLDNVATDGIFSLLNTILCGFVEEVFTSATCTELALVDGGNENLNDNLNKIAKWFISNTPDNYEGINGWATVKANAATNTLEGNAVAVLKCFFKDWFGTEYTVPANATSLEALGAFAAYAAIDKFVVGDKEEYPDWSFGNYKDQILDASGNMLTKTDEEWTNLILTIGLDVAVYALNHNSKSTNFTLSADDAKKYKESGWSYEYYLDEITDWGIAYINHIPAITDELTAVRGEYDGFGPFYKINVVLNKLLPLALFTDCGDGYFTFDSKTFFIDKLLGGILDFDFNRIVDTLSVNTNAENPFNKNIISGVIDIVENLIFGIFEHDASVGTETATFAATSTSVGYEYVKGTVDQFYKITKTLDKVAESTVTLGDVNGDTKINTKDARLILRYAAKLETLSDDQMTAADVNKDTKVNTKDARKILRVVAKLDTI